MTERKKTRLAIFHKLDAGNVPAPWVPAELPAAKDAPGLALAKRDRINALPTPWVPAELPAVNSAPRPAKRDRAIAKRMPWVPPAAAPRNLPAVSEDGGGGKSGALQPAAYLPAAAQNTGGAAGPIVVNIVNKVEAPAPVYVAPWWGWWGGGCARAFCPHRFGRTCWRFWCW